MGAVGGSTSRFDVQAAEGYAGDVSPNSAWTILNSDKSSALIDVRTDAELSYVGQPDLAGLGKSAVLLAWQIFPAMAVNGAFVESLSASGIAKDAALLFLCRSGVRSKAAAIAATKAGFTRAYNIADGFEGPLDGGRHRGTAAGWKASGLPWVQK